MAGPANVSSPSDRGPSGAQPTRIRIAKLADAQSLVRVINEAFVVERMAFDGNRVDPGGVRELMGKGTFLVAEDPDSLLLVGCVYLEPSGESCYLGLLSVIPPLQGRGLGGRLTAAAEEFARNAGCRVMDLRIISPRAESLLPVYKRLGYSEAGMAPFPVNVPTKVPCHYILMVKDLVQR
jgi:GNAT superfamily N-acetyltransferase